MRVSVELPPEIEAAIVAQARANGVPVETYLQQILRESIGTESIPTKTRSQIAGERIRELRKGVTLGGIPIKKLVEEGRE